MGVFYCCCDWGMFAEGFAEGWKSPKSRKRIHWVVFCLLRKSRTRSTHMDKSCSNPVSPNPPSKSALPPSSLCSVPFVYWFMSGQSTTVTLPSHCFAARPLLIGPCQFIQGQTATVTFPSHRCVARPLIIGPCHANQRPSRPFFLAVYPALLTAYWSLSI